MSILSQHIVRVEALPEEFRALPRPPIQATEGVGDA